MSDASLWSSYIQINIYGRKLRDLDQEGVDVGQFLKLNGCGKFWMGEVPMMNSDSDSGLDSSGEEDLEMVETTQMIDGTKLLSTTVADVKFPPCSTPLISKRWPSFNMTTSRISKACCFQADDESEHLFDDRVNRETDGVAREILDEIIQKLETDGHSSRDLSHLECPPALVCWKTEIPQPSPARQVPRARLSLPSKLSCLNQLNPRAGRKLGVLKTVKQESTVLLNNTDEPRFYHQLANIQFNVQDDVAFANDMKVEHRREDGGEEHTSVPRVPRVFTETSEYGWHDDVEDEFHSFDEHDETVQIDQEFSFVRHSPPPPNSLKTKSIMRKSTINLQPLKRVSFKVTRKQAGDHYRKLNELHKIPCKFNNCGRVLNWKMKYGKLKLINHALIHSTGPNLSCGTCSYKCTTLRQMRSHYQKVHDGSRMEGFGMLKVFSMQLGTMDMITLWRTCYGDKLDIVGDLNKKRRMLRHKKQRGFGEEEDDSESEGPGPSASRHNHEQDLEGEEPTIRIR